MSTRANKGLEFDMDKPKPLPAEMAIEIHDGVRPDLCGEIARLVLESSTRTASKGSNNSGGWKSADTFLSWNFPAVNLIACELAARLTGGEVHKLTAWAMVNRNGSLHKRHRHGERYRVGVYYVAAGDPPVPTLFDIEKYRVGTLQGSGEIVRRESVLPIPGRLVVFPGNMWHEVPRYDGSEPRITIAFEAR